MGCAPGIRELRQAVCRAAALFDPALMDRSTAVETVSEWSAIVNAAQAACDMASARVVECGTPVGSPNAEDDLANRMGTSKTKASERARHGKRLREQEKTRDAATSGALSGDQATLISDAVDANPDAEQGLLDTAAHKSHAELKDECARTKAAADKNPDATEARIHAKRCVRRYTDAEGAAHLRAVGTKRDMAKLDAAISREVDTIFNAKRAAGEREPYDAYLFDALITLADGVAGDGTSSIRHLGVLRVDWEALVRGRVVGDETCEIAGLGPVPVRTARDMLGESILKLVVTKGVDVVNVVHLGRGPTAAQKIALVWSRPRCTNQACGRMFHLEIDHRDAWANCHETVLDNLDPLCTHDHDLKTHHGWALVNGKGPRAFVPPDHPDHPKRAGPKEQAP
jgi:hypothetical protein